MTRTLLVSALLLVSLGSAVAAPPDDAGLARYRHASACVAVMKQDATALAERYRAGATAVRPEVVRLTELGFTFIGTAYKSGLRNPQADQLLDEAEQAQQGQPASALKQLSADCQAEGAKLLRDSNALERALVSNRARARVDRLLASPKTP
ncbi:MAG TPA: hypothetical protein VLA16_05385 [Ideonella sp.]|nr:hypothetical protein [Ideonella sp.]